MTTRTSTRPTASRSSHVSPFHVGLASALFVAVVLAACAGGGAATTETASDPARSETRSSASSETIVTEDVAGTSRDVVAETRSEIGPRALDVDAAMMLVVDALDLSGDDIFVRVRVVNGSDQFLNVEDENDLYGPLLVIRDDRDNTYPARAVEPAGVGSYTVGRMRFRVDGPFDPRADEFTVEVATSRGRLTTDPIAVPEGGVVRWWTESPPMHFSDRAVGGQDARTVHVTDIVDRGSHIDVRVEASDPSAGFSIPDDVSATLTLADGSEFASLVLDPSAVLQTDEFGGVLRFLGTVPDGSDALMLSIAGMDVEIQLERASAGAPAQSTAIEPPFADPPRLPDLLHFDVHPEPLPTTTITI